MYRVSLVTLLTLGVLNAAFAQLLWSDEFDSGSQPDSSFWSYDLGASGWGNQELQEYTSSSTNVSISDGNLHIVARAGGSVAPFTSARIRSEGKLTFQYGTIEARIKIPDLADGLWPAFWTMGDNFSEVGWPNCGELDVMELGSSSAIAQGVVNRRVGSTAHWENLGTTASYGLTLDASADLNDDYHLYRMEWTPSAVTTYLDGQQIWEIDITPASCTDCSEFHQPHFIILNMAVGGSYTGRLSAAQITASTPAEMLVDYVRVFDNGFTQLGGTGVADMQESIGPAHSGSWYNSEQSGHGFSMEFGERPDGSPLAVIYWYTYDSEGNPLFLVGNAVPDGEVVEVEFQSSFGMSFGEFDPDSVVREEAGTGRFEFSDRDNGTFSYTPSEDSVTRWGHSPIEDLPLSKLFGIPVSTGGSR